MGKKTSKFNLNVSRLGVAIDELPNREVDASDLKSLILDHILDTPDDHASGNYAVRAKVKLESLKLLHEIIKSEDQDSMSKALMSALMGSDDDDDDLVADMERHVSGLAD